MQRACLCVCFNEAEALETSEYRRGAAGAPRDPPGFNEAEALETSECDLPVADLGRPPSRLQ